jgi:hypothetical protein
VDGKTSYRYRVEFQTMMVLLRFVLDEEKVALIEYEGVQMK